MCLLLLCLVNFADSFKSILHTFESVILEKYPHSLGIQVRLALGFGEGRENDIKYLCKGSSVCGVWSLDMYTIRFVC
jgi:hypothetical protein